MTLYCILFNTLLLLRLKNIDMPSTYTQHTPNIPQAYISNLNPNIPLPYILFIIPNLNFNRIKNDT